MTSLHGWGRGGGEHFQHLASAERVRKTTWFIRGVALVYPRYGEVCLPVPIPHSGAQDKVKGAGVSRCKGGFVPLAPSVHRSDLRLRGGLTGGRASWGARLTPAGGGRVALGAAMRQFTGRTAAICRLFHRVCSPGERSGA